LYAMSFGRQIPMFQRNSYLCFQGRPSLSLPSLLVPLAVDSQTAYSILKMEAAGSSNTLVTIYKKLNGMIFQKTITLKKMFSYSLFKFINLFLHPVKDGL